MSSRFARASSTGSTSAPGNLESSRIATPGVRKAWPSGQARRDRIIDRVRAIPRGFVRTYGDIDPAAPRLVGQVLASTDERLPWHRVVRADGRAPMGTAQLERLRREGVPLRGGRVDLGQARLPG